LKRIGDVNKIVFFTSSKFKFEEASKIAQNFGLDMIRKSEDIIEIQSESLEEIALFKARQLMKKYRNLTFVVEDDGIFIEALNGFPGPYSSYVYKTIGNHGILKLMKGEVNRKALFKSVVVLYAHKIGLKSFTGICKGTIAKSIHHGRMFGYDPIFKPLKADKCFSEMTPEEKNLFSHRAKSFKKVFSFLIKIRSTINGEDYG